MFNKIAPNAIIARITIRNNPKKGVRVKILRRTKIPNAEKHNFQKLKPESARLFSQLDATTDVMVVARRISMTQLNKRIIPTGIPIKLTRAINAATGRATENKKPYPSERSVEL